MAWDAAARESTPTPPDGDVHRPAFVNGNGPGARAGADEGTEQGAAAGVVHEAAQNATFVSGVRDTLVSMPGGAGRVLDGDNPAIKQEIIRMVAAYLEGEGYLSSAMTLMDEANVVKREARKAEQQQRQKSKGVHKAILDGDWAEVEKFCNRSSLRSMKDFLYCVYKQQYLELVERQEYQKAFTYLTKKLKPFEKQRLRPEEFKDLCYLLTCKSIADVDKDWDGIASARARLAAVFTSLLADSEVIEEGAEEQDVPAGRLLRLMEQAVQHQIASSHYQPKVLPPISTLLRDYECFVLPNSLRHEYKGHTANTKCLSFLGEDGSYLVSGSSDRTLRVWRVGHPEIAPLVLSGHTSRVWDLSVCKSTKTVIASASGDSTVQVWNVDRMLVELDSRRGEPAGRSSGALECEAMSTMSGHRGDVYTVAYHPVNNLVVSGGYDKTVRLWDVEKAVQSRCFYGHEASVTCLAYSAQGNMVVSGCKDGTVRFWDVLSGLMVNSIPNFGDVTSVDVSANGMFLLTASKGNSNRLWDLRKMAAGDAGKYTRLYKGHQNTSTNFIRASFGPSPSLVMSGSEDGFAYIWDRQSGAPVQRLGGVTSTVYSPVWSAAQSLLATASHDGVIRTWWYDETKPIEFVGE
mmetsp:Transcript_61293/g.146413  ORF Transcript_61293/g.146413 Transcript_61293/m.146413 type:complete len:633 (+) Transcript_61293:145-2043(+)